LSYHRLGTPWRRLPLEGLDVHGFAMESPPRQGIVYGRVAPGGADWLWLATSRGLWEMNIESGESLGPWLVPAPIIGSAVVGLAHDAQGRLWVATRDGVSFIAPDGVTQAALVEPIYCLESDRVGQIWAGGAGGLYRLAADETPQRVLEVPIRVLGFGAENRPYACTTEGQLLALADPLGADQPEPLADLAALADAMPRDLDVDSKGVIWFATERGLGSLTPEGEFDLSTEGDRLLSSDVRAVDVGVDDLVWVATAKGPARRRPDGRWTRFTTQSTEGGLRAMEMWHLYAPDDGTLWMATSAGISRREPENADWAYFDLPEPRIVLPDGRGGVWIGTRSGLYRVREDALVPVE
jgi:ligand-binding sensor domain-containing protein